MYIITYYWSQTDRNFIFVDHIFHRTSRPGALERDLGDVILLLLFTRYLAYYYYYIILYYTRRIIRRRHRKV